MCDRPLRLIKSDYDIEGKEIIFSRKIILYLIFLKYRIIIKNM